MNSSFPSLDLIKMLPKIELHAHLNGSVRRETLKELALLKNLTFNEECFTKKDLKSVFMLFDLIHKTLIDLSSIKRVTIEMLEDFYKQNVIYLELRTTPKSNQSLNFTKKDYILTILNEIISFENLKNQEMKIRVFLSIDRSRTIEESWETYNLLKELKSSEIYGKYLLGLDYSGNPYKNTFLDYFKIFDEARKNNFQTAIHIAETEGENCLNETKDILEFKPDRLGHFNYFNEDLLKKLLELKIPLEMCPTSNFFTVGLNHLKDHHFKQFFDAGHPICICTDDTGVFDSDLNNEIFQIFNVFSLNQNDLVKYSLNSTQCIIDSEIRIEIYEKINNFLKTKIF